MIVQSLINSAWFRPTTVDLQAVDAAGFAIAVTGQEGLMMPIQADKFPFLFGHKTEAAPGGAVHDHGNRAGSSTMNRRMQLLEGQNEVLELVAKGADACKSLGHLVEVMERLIESDFCAVQVLDPGSNELHPVDTPNLPGKAKDMLSGVKLVPGKTPSATAAYRREPLVVADLLSDPAWPETRQFALSIGVRAWWTQPILSQDGETLGTLDFFHRGVRVPDEEQYGTMDALCPIARMSIEHERRGQALNQADKQLTSLAQNLPGVVYQRTVSPDGEIRYTYISDGAYDLFGVSPQEVLADPQAIFDRHGPDYRATFRENLLFASRNLEMWDVEAPIITRDGEHKWTHAIARPHRQPDGTVVWNGIILDATRLKRANLELAASNRAKDEFLANMSHELRTPLNAIIGFSEMMKHELMGEIGVPEYRQYIRDIHASGQHLLEVINDILDLAKIEANSLDLNEEILDPREELDGCVRLITPKANDNDIGLSFDSSAGTRSLRADMRMFKQIFLNILSNAVKFTPSGGEVSVNLRIAKGGELIISVADTGIGIPPELLPTVFEPFAQVDSGLDRKFEGTGLGLPLTKSMVELHDGSIHIDSRPDIGTVVTVTFPKDRLID